MITLKKIGISILGIIVSLLLLTLFLTTFSYINWFGSKMIATMKIIIPIISLFVGGFLIGRKSNQKGWLEGLKVSLVFLVILIIFNFLALHIGFEWKQLIYYGILIISSIFGSIIGINFKKSEN